MFWTFQTYHLPHLSPFHLLYSPAVAQLSRKGQTLQDLDDAVNWQIDSMSAYSNGAIPPPPPPNVMKVINAQREASQPPSMGFSTIPERVTPPFTGSESCFKTDDGELLEALQKLQSDHERLVNLGAEYGRFDGLGRVAFIDEVEKIEDRWAVLMSKVNLMGQVNSAFKVETEEFLGGILGRLVGA